MKLRWFLLLIAMTGSLLAMATTAGAAHMGIPACEEILSVQEAQVAMSGGVSPKSQCPRVDVIEEMATVVYPGR